MASEARMAQLGKEVRMVLREKQDLMVPKAQLDKMGQLEKKVLLARQVLQDIQAQMVL
jgi:hypothetical protein